MDPSVAAAIITGVALVVAAWLGRPRPPGRGDDKSDIGKSNNTGPDDK
jgi:hypothetical protein